MIYINAFEGKVSLDGDTYILNEDFTITDNTNFPITIEDGTTFDGSNNTITYNGTNNWEGLFEAADNSHFTVQTAILICMEVIR